MAKRTINGFDIITNINLNPIEEPEAPPQTGGGFFDDFESETRPVEYTGDWFITPMESKSGANSLRSASITHDQSSCIEITIPSDGYFAFDYKVSSESGWDFFEFYINDSKVFEESGDTGWVSHSEFVSSGDVIKWCYRKDGSVSEYADAVYIDSVEFEEMDVSALPCIPEWKFLTTKPIYSSRISTSTGDVIDTQNTMTTVWPTKLGYTVFIVYPNNHETYEISSEEQFVEFGLEPLYRYNTMYHLDSYTYPTEIGLYVEITDNNAVDVEIDIKVTDDNNDNMPVGSETLTVLASEYDENPSQVYRVLIPIDTQNDFGNGIEMDDGYMEKKGKANTIQITKTGGVTLHIKEIMMCKDGEPLTDIYYRENGDLNPAFTPEEEPSFCIPYHEITLADMRYNIEDAFGNVYEENHTIDTLWQQNDSTFSLGTYNGWYVFQRGKADSGAQSGLEIYEPRQFESEFGDFILSSQYYPDKYCIYFSFYDVAPDTNPSITLELYDGYADGGLFGPTTLASASKSMTYDEYTALISSGTLPEYQTLELTPGDRNQTSYFIPNSDINYDGPERPTTLRVLTGNHGVRIHLIRPLNSDGTEYSYIFDDGMSGGGVIVDVPLEACPAWHDMPDDEKQIDSQLQDLNSGTLLKEGFYKFYEIWSPLYDYQMTVQPSNRLLDTSMFVGDEYANNLEMAVHPQYAPYEWDSSGADYEYTPTTSSDELDKLCFYIEIPQGVDASGFDFSATATTALYYTSEEPVSVTRDFTLTYDEYNESPSKVFKFEIELPNFNSFGLKLTLTSWNYKTIYVHDIRATHNGEPSDYYYSLLLG